MDETCKCCDPVIVAMYTFTPPGRGEEVGTLKIQRNWQECHANQIKDRNILLVKNSEEVTLHFHSYKPAKFYGRQELTLRVTQSSRMT